MQIMMAWVIMEDFLVQFLRKEKERKRTKQKPKKEYKNYEVNPSR